MGERGGRKREYARETERGRGSEGEPGDMNIITELYLIEAFRHSQNHIGKVEKQIGICCYGSTA